MLSILFLIVFLFLDSNNISDKPYNTYYQRSEVIARTC